MATGQFIKFHSDVIKRTIQIAVNGEEDYMGGRLIFATNSALYAPERPEGTVTIYHNDIAHGVSVLEIGIRYGHSVGKVTSTYLNDLYAPCLDRMTRVNLRACKSWLFLFKHYRSDP
jgi:hypothetical protein